MHDTISGNSQGVWLPENVHALILSSDDIYVIEFVLSLSLLPFIQGTLSNWSRDM